MHVRTGALVIGYVELAVVCLYVAYVLGSFFAGGDLHVRTDDAADFRVPRNDSNAPKYAGASRILGQVPTDSCTGFAAKTFKLIIVIYYILFISNI